MGDKYGIRDNESIYFSTFTVVDWIDVFTRKDYRDLVLENLAYCRLNKGLKLHGYVIMSNHIHMVVSSKEGFELASTMRDLKTYLSKQIVKAILNNPKESRQGWMIEKFKWHRSHHKQQYQFWQMGNHSISLYDNKMIDTKLDYIHQNPVRAGLVDSPQDWNYSSSRNYILGKGIIEIDEI